MRLKDKIAVVRRERSIYVVSDLLREDLDRIPEVRQYR